MLRVFDADSRPMCGEKYRQAVALGFHPALAEWLAREACVSDASSLDSYLTKHHSQLYDPMLLNDIEKAVERTIAAIRKQEPILIFGDFDVDGLSASCVLYWGLRKAGPTVRPQVFLPNRFCEGHGLKPHQVTEFARQGIKLIITADCGMGSAAEIALAQAAGISVIVTDHHLPEAEILGATAVVNPRLGEYPCDALAGVGVAYKFIHALLRAIHGEEAEPTQSFLQNCLDYVAIGTIADVVPLVTENRVLVHQGLKHMMNSRLPFLKDFWQRKILRTELGEVFVPEHVGFYMAPRLNAASRLDSAWPAFRFLTATTQAEVKHFGEMLESFNQERIRRLKDLKESADLEIHEFAGVPVLLVHSHTREIGLMGLLASSLSEKAQKSVIALAISPSGELHGSARGLAGINLKEILDYCSDLLVSHGGHARAAGVKLLASRFEEFKDRLSTMRLPVSAVQESPDVYSACLAAEEYTPNLLDQQIQLGPFGEQNPRPNLAILGMRVLKTRRVGREQKDLSLDLVASSSGQRLGAIGFGLGEFAKDIETAQGLVGTLDYNYFGSRKPQFLCKGVIRQSVV